MRSLTLNVGDLVQREPVTTKITNYRKNLPKSQNQNHKRCVTKSPNKTQQKSRNVAGVNQALSLELYSLGL